MAAVGLINHRGLLVVALSSSKCLTTSSTLPTPTDSRLANAISWTKSPMLRRRAKSIDDDVEVVGDSQARSFRYSHEWWRGTADSAL